jgi:hypothetical protein
MRNIILWTVSNAMVREISLPAEIKKKEYFPYSNQNRNGRETD